jgi:S-adenosylmethionine decarboxylase
VGVLADTLRALPAELGLTRIGEPVVSAQEGGGVAGVVLLAESHASLHAVPHAGTLFADVFSCAPFSADAALAVLTRAYAPAAIDARLVERGPAFGPRGEP